MLEIFFGIVAIGGGFGYILMGDPLRKLLGFFPIFMFVIPFGMSVAGEMLPVATHFMIEAVGALAGGILYQKGRMEKVARVAETGEE